MPELLKSQKAALFEILKENGFSPGAFELTLAYGSHGKTIGNSIRFKDSNFHFTARLGETYGFSVNFTPGEERTEEGVHVGSFPEIYFHQGRWLQYLERELTAPDPWAAISDYSTLLDVHPITNHPNTPFTYTEVEAIGLELRRIEASLISHAESNASHRKMIEAQIEFLIESSKRMGRKDWLLVVIGSFVTIASAMSLSPEVARQIFDQLKNAVDGIIHVAPMLA